ncbi:hypothetical protein [uncultured Sunxiuqinia sp.]|uniref:hypothetical protein n=1 Tax=uncultured Sunxiuqinia sp. TaxID=1573825 RepID=UPI002625EFB3|nr:hypothetical protein [uncultured Sunxiuqinia sp.]
MQVISNNIRQMRTANDQEKLQQQIKEKAYQLRTYKASIPMNYEVFKQLITYYAQEILVQRSVNAQYTIDRHNGPIIKQLYLYFTNNPECAWNLNAGLVFGGKIGCGKSVLMMAYLNLSNEYSRRRTTMVHSKTLAGLIKQKGMEFYEKRPLFIDELGREESEVKDFGNVIKPVIDLFALRYEAGSRTYATTNFNFDGLEKFYTAFIRSRMEEMMTLVHMPGESRRLKNQVKTK